MTTLRIFVAILAVAFAGLIAWALTAGDFSAAGAWLMSDPWGIVTLADLYLGLFLSAVLIAIFERRWQALFWIAPLPFLGNVWTAIWFILRLPRLFHRLSGSASSW